jgi:hypothetical protein
MGKKKEDRGKRSMWKKIAESKGGFMKQKKKRKKEEGILI